MASSTYSELGPALDQFVHRLDRAARFLLVLGDVANLPVVAEPDDVLRVGRVGIGRIKRHVALGGVDGVIIVALPVLREGGHHHRFARLLRIGMLAVDGFELLAGFLEVALLEIGQALIVEHIGRLGLLDIGGEIDVFLGRACRQQRESAGAQRHQRSANDLHRHHFAFQTHP